MIYFKIVEKKPFGYFFLRKWLSLIFCHAYYKRVYVFGKKNLPAAGTPFMMVSNHQNGLLDALAIVFTMPLRYTMVFLARADVFRKNIVAKILNFCKIMPIYRQRDGRENLGENTAIFDESAKLVGQGFPVTLFPEGGLQEGHYLGQVKKGFARIAFEAAERNDYPEDMVIVPVGNHYSDYFAKRAKLCVRFGEPIRLSPYYALYKENPPKAMTLLAQEIQLAIRSLMLDIPDTEHYPTYDFLREVVRPCICKEEGLRKAYFPHQWHADRIFAERLQAMANQDNGSFDAEPIKTLRQKTEDYRKALATLRIKPEDIENPMGFLEAFLRIIALAVGLPLAIYGICFTGLPILIGRRKSAAIATRIKNKMLQSSFDFVITQLICTGLFYLLYIIAYWVCVDCIGIGVAWAWGGFFLLLASWVLTRAFWQDYMRYACRSLQRLRASVRKKQCRALQKLKDDIIAPFCRFRQ